AIRSKVFLPLLLTKEILSSDWENYLRMLQHHIINKQNKKEQLRIILILHLLVFFYLLQGDLLALNRTLSNLGLGLKLFSIETLDFLSGMLNVNRHTEDTGQTFSEI